MNYDSKIKNMLQSKIKSFLKIKVFKVLLILLVGSFLTFIFLDNIHAINSGPLTLVDVGPFGLVAGQGIASSRDLGGVDMSYDGRYAVFSTATNLTPTTTNRTKVYVKDIISGEIQLASMSNSGEANDGAAFDTSISGDGRYVVFASPSTNLDPLIPSSNNRFNIFMFDREAGQISLISKSENGTSSGNGTSSKPDISQDGKLIVFLSFSTNLTSDSIGQPGNRARLYLYNKETNQIRLISKNQSGQPNNQSVLSPRISGDGRYVVFSSNANNLISGTPTLSSRQIYLYDSQNQSFSIISKSSSNEFANANSLEPSISQDGRFISFQSGATNLVPGVSSGNSNIYVYDTQSQQISVGNLGINGEILPNSHKAEISPNGRYLVFNSVQSSTIPQNITDGTISSLSGVPNTYLRDLLSSTTQIISRRLDGQPSSSGDSLRDANAISFDGRFAGFVSSAATSQNNSLVLGVFDNKYHYYIFDRNYIAPPPGGGTGSGPSNSCISSSSDSLVRVLGYGWMGVNIQPLSGQSQGGLGWLKFNCSQGEPNWGVRVVLNEGGSNHGQLVGQAWSNNNGWMSFDEDTISSCWSGSSVNPHPHPAKVMFDGTQNPRVSGWGKFINGDDELNDGYDGCVSFSGDNYTVSVNIPTGELRGWAWGGDVVGWLSFQNSECPFCDTEIDFPEVLCDDPLAINHNQSGACIYEPLVPGCTDPSALNYNSSANQDDGSCIISQTPSGRPNLNLSVTPGSFVIGSPNYNGQFAATDIQWTSNNPSQIASNSCVGSFAVNSGGLTQTSTLSGWTGGRVNPNSTLSNVVVPQAATALTGTQLVFTITCQTVTGENITATDSIIMTAGPAVTATLELRIDSPNINPPNGDTSFEILGAGGATVTLGWDSENVQPGSCVASSFKTPDTLGSNNQWEGSVPDSGTRQINMLTVGGIGNGVSTQFRITCNDANGFTPISRVVNVCIADTACPVTQSGLFPGYQEF